MNFRLIDSVWDRELADAAAAGPSALRVVCPFIKEGALRRLLNSGRPKELQVITRFNLADFAEGVSDLSALRFLLSSGAEVRGVRNLHAKLYVFGESRAIVTSANLTDAALLRNHEFGFVSEDLAIVERCREYFENLWARAGECLNPKRLNEWDERLASYLAAGGRPDWLGRLGDEGADAGAATETPSTAPWASEATQFFVKFLGEGADRVPLSFSNLEEIKRSGCHWALAYPTKKRPSGVKDGAVMFIGRFTREPDDVRIFGRAIAMRHVPGRDDATPEDIAMRDWKKIWPRYVRVHHAEFVRGTMSNGVSLNVLMDELKTRSFVATMRNAEGGTGNTNPRRAYRQQPAVELSTEGMEWLFNSLEAAFRQHGRVSQAELASLDWPMVSNLSSSSGP